ncbi:DUF443 family protein [Lactobacillus sp. YT155]|uniref:DUF443 family protein n=1 Tax=Lactobacillus sp. YT155 TaxID=3060955 RepID=UPI00265F6A80|nr:DUF443 family protein [Lactobacillus sp. YT155]MDO1604808.1 DUF443 family protein [Lactobacillus sp. YT155]
MTKTKIESEPLTGNRRYIILNTADKHYLIDTDAPIFLVQLFPFLTWIIRHKCYEITPKQWNELSGPGVEEKMSPGDVAILGSGLSFIVGPFLLKMSNLVRLNNQLLENLIFFIGIIGVILIRIYSIKRKKIDSSYFDEKKMIKAKIKFSFGDMMKYFFIFLSELIFAVIAITMKFAFSYDLVVTVAALFFIYVYLIMNEGVWKWNEESYLEIDD